MPIGLVEAFGQAMAQFPDAPAEQLADYIRQHFGFKIETKYFPIYRAALQETERWNQRRAFEPKTEP